MKAKGAEGRCRCVTVEVEYHFLGGWVAEPVRFRAVRERDISGGEALLLGECWIKIIKTGDEISTRVFSAGCLSWADCAIFGKKLEGTHWSCRTVVCSIRVLNITSMTWFLYLADPDFPLNKAVKREIRPTPTELD